jgi:hypothetical protein
MFIHPMNELISAAIIEEVYARGILILSLGH